MPTGIFYLPEYHDFKYLAQAPWPHMNINGQDDWVDAISELENWLNRFVGPHYAEWAYGQQQTLDYWQACIAFRRERNKTLFLLAWSR